MDKTTNTNANNTPAPQAPPETPAPQAPPSPPPAPPQQLDPVAKFVGAVDTLGPNIELLNTSVKSAAALLGAQVEHLKQMQESFDKEKLAFQAKVTEVSARLDAVFAVQEITAKQLAECAKKLDIATSKTVEGMIDKILSAIPGTEAKPTVGTQEGTTQAGTDDFYKTFIDRYQKILTSK